MNAGNYCQNCQYDESNVTSTVKITDKILRERCCKQCKLHYFTIEIITCPKCNEDNSKVLQTNRKDTYIERKRVCNTCNSIYKTYESTAGYMRYNSMQYRAMIISTNQDILSHFRGSL